MKNKKNITIIDDIEVHLIEPENIEKKWIHNKDPLRQLNAAFVTKGESETPMTPCLIGQSGIGKTTLALHFASQYLKKPVFLFQCTSATSADDLLIMERTIKKKSIYMGSGLIAALLYGGTLILDDAHLLSEDVWSRISTLIDERNYILSPFSNKKIFAHTDFKLLTTVNDSQSLFNIPDYIYSLLTPKIPIPTPRQNEIYDILKANVKMANDELINYVIDYMKNAPIVSNIKDSINILRYSLKIIQTENTTLQEAINISIDLNPHIKYQEIEKDYFQLINKS